MRRTGLFISHLSNVFYSKVQVVPKRITSPSGEFLLVKCHMLIDKLFCPDPMAGNISDYATQFRFYPRVAPISHLAWFHILHSLFICAQVGVLLQLASPLLPSLIGYTACW